MPLIDLRRASGLPLKLDGHKLVFGKGMKKVVPEARTRQRMMPVLKNPAANAPSEFYYMYRGVCLEKHRKKIRAAGLRYDITILPAFTVGDEYNKTFGHYHPLVKGTSTAFPEVYEVLRGRALYLLQNDSEFLVFDAREGYKCVMLPGFGHVTVNPSSLRETLVMANWVCPDFASDYGPIERHGGAQWLYTVKGFAENRKYGLVPGIKLLQPKNFPGLGLTSKPVYTEGVKNPKKLEWLTRPQEYLQLFEEYRKE